MSETLIVGIIGGACTVVAAVATVIITYQLNRKKEKDSLDLIRKLKEENAILKSNNKILVDAFPKNFEIIRDVDDVLHNKILPILSREGVKGKKILIQNFGLDLHSVMPWMQTKLILSEEFDNVYIDVRSLIINPDSEYIKAYIDGKSNISSNTISSSITIGKDFANHEDLDRFSLEMRQYDLPPVFHGFLINEEHLFLGFTEISTDKIVGGNKPYLYLWRSGNSDSELNTHYFKFYKDWFNYYWQISKVVVNVRK